MGMASLPPTLLPSEPGKPRASESGGRKEGRSLSLFARGSQPSEGKLKRLYSGNRHGLDFRFRASTLTFNPGNSESIMLLCLLDSQSLCAAEGCRTSTAEVPHIPSAGCIAATLGVLQDSRAEPGPKLN